MGGQSLAEFAIMSIIGYHKHQTKYGRLFVLKEPRGEYWYCIFPLQALKDPKYCVVYANLCKVMSTIKLEVLGNSEGKTRVITFRRVLLTRVQQEFESKERKEDEKNMLNVVKETHYVSGWQKWSDSLIKLHILVESA